MVKTWVDSVSSGHWIIFFVCLLVKGKWSSTSKLISVPVNMMILRECGSARKLKKFSSQNTHHTREHRERVEMLSKHWNLEAFIVSIRWILCICIHFWLLLFLPAYTIFIFSIRTLNWNWTLRLVSLLIPYSYITSYISYSYRMNWKTFLQFLLFTLFHDFSHSLSLTRIYCFSFIFFSIHFNSSSLSHSLLDITKYITLYI